MPTPDPSTQTLAAMLSQLPPASPARQDFDIIANTLSSLVAFLAEQKNMDADEKTKRAEEMHAKVDYALKRVTATYQELGDIYRSLSEKDSGTETPTQ